MTNSHDRRVALVTGGTSGIGRCVAYGLRDDGFEVAVMARSPASLGPRAGTFAPAPTDPEQTCPQVEAPGRSAEQYPAGAVRTSPDEGLDS